MNRYILHLNSSLCSEIKPSFYETCELTDQEGSKASGDECVVDNQRCPDGTYNKTCITLVINEDETSSMCSCHYNRQPQVSTSQYHWSRWNMLTDSRVGISREINDVLVTNPPALAREYRWVHVT